MPEHQDRIVAALMERLIAHGPEGMGQVFAELFNLALRPEREQFLAADHGAAPNGGAVHARASDPGVPVVGQATRPAGAVRRR